MVSSCVLGVCLCVCVCMNSNVGVYTTGIHQSNLIGQIHVPDVLLMPVMHGWLLFIGCSVSSYQGASLPHEPKSLTAQLSLLKCVVNEQDFNFRSLLLFPLK